MSLAAGRELLTRTGILRQPLATVRALRGMGGIPALIELAAAGDADRPVLVRDERVVAAGELAAAVRRAARGLAARREPGSTIAVASDGGVDSIVALAAGLHAGFSVLPFGPRLGADVALLTAEHGIDLIVSDTAGLDGPPFAPRRPGRLLLLSTGTSGLPHTTTRATPGPAELLQLASALERMRLPRDGALLLLAPPDHGHGLSLLLAGLLRDGPVLLAASRPPEAALELAARHRATAVSGVPAQLGMLLGGDVRFRVAVSGSAPLRIDLADRLMAGLGARVVDAYGTTETGTLAVGPRRPGDPAVGRPLATVRLAIVDDTGARLARGEVGRILARSALAGGRPVLLPDLGRLGEDGRLEVLGRADGLGDSGGETIAPERTAASLRAIRGVTAATVRLEPDDLLGSVLVAEVTADGLDEVALRRELGRSLPRAQQPRRLSVRPPG